MADDTPASLQEQLDTLKTIDGTTEQLKNEGKFLEALQCMEKGLILRGHCHGMDSTEVNDAWKAVGNMCNYIALVCLDKNQFKMALELLKKAEVLTVRHRSERAVTLNNFGCYYRKTGKLRTAASFLEKAIKLESFSDDITKRADTHLNLCTVLSELGRYRDAHAHALAARKYMLKELFGPINSEVYIYI